MESVACPIPMRIIRLMGRVVRGRSVPVCCHLASGHRASPVGTRLAILPTTIPNLPARHITRRTNGTSYIPRSASHLSKMGKLGERTITIQEVLSTYTCTNVEELINVEEVGWRPYSSWMRPKPSTGQRKMTDRNRCTSWLWCVQNEQGGSARGREREKKRRGGSQRTIDEQDERYSSACIYIPEAMAPGPRSETADTAKR